MNALGRGTFGIVYLAEDKRTGQKVALKIPRPEVLVEPEKIKRFETEALLASQLKHPGIVEVYEIEISSPTPYIAAAYCNGPNLAEWLHARSEPWPWRDCVNLMARIADAVDYAHGKGITHRDLKPANIMLVSGNDDDFDSLDQCDPKITDFGFAKLNDPRLTETQSSVLVGTPSYMAPEQMHRRFESNHSEATDIYAMGVILFELLTRTLPIAGETYFEVLDNIRTSRPLKVRSIRRELPTGIEKIIGTCLQKNPQARYQTAAALAQDLRNCVADQPVRGKHTSWMQKSIFWCTHPSRIKTAGAFTLGCQALSIFWLSLASVSIWAFEIVSWTDYLGIMLQVCLLIFLFMIPMCWAGWLALQGSRLGLWIAMTLTTFNIPFALVPIFDKPMIFQPLYDGHNPYFSFAVHTMPASCFVVQAFLLVCALIATRPQPIEEKG